MNKDTAKIYVTKLAAAERQLRAAIQMYFYGMDELAVHTVAFAVYRILSDIKKKRGRNVAGDTFFTGVFYAIRDYHRGTASKLFYKR
jgi:hypothetical protein